MTDVELIAAYRAGSSTAEIAIEIGCARQTVSNRLKRLDEPLRSRGESLRGKPKTPEHRAKLSDVKRRYWDAHPDRVEFGAKISAAKRVTGMMSGRPMLYIPGRGKVKEHRYVMEQALGRELRPDEHVHHRNRDKTDNRIENLELMSPSDHGRLHSKQRWANGEMEATREMNRARPRDVNGRFI